MRLSDDGLRRPRTKLIYPDHRSSPWLFFVWLGRSSIPTLAQPRRVRGVTLTRLTDSRLRDIESVATSVWQFFTARSLEPIVRCRHFYFCPYHLATSRFSAVKFPLDPRRCRSAMLQGTNRYANHHPAMCPARNSATSISTNTVMASQCGSSLASELRRFARIFPGSSRKIGNVSQASAMLHAKGTRCAASLCAATRNRIASRMSFKAPNDEVERRAVAWTPNKADLSQSSTVLRRSRCSHVPMLARPRRVRGVTLTRLPDLPP